MRLASFALTAALASGCIPTDTGNDPILVPVPPEVRSAPETITVNGEAVVLGAALWRDFMPESPRNGSPLQVLASPRGADPSTMTSKFEVLRLLVVRGDRAWLARFEPAASIPEQIAVSATDGPKWGPDERVDVVTRLRLPDGKETWLAVRGVNIARTD